MDPMDMADADTWIEEAGKYGGLRAEFEAVQGVIAAQTLRQQSVGEGDISDLYPWYIEHLKRLHDIAQRIAPRGTWADVRSHLGQPDFFSDVALMMMIRAILATLPEVPKPENEMEVMVVSAKALDSDAENSTVGSGEEPSS